MGSRGHVGNKKHDQDQDIKTKAENNRPAAKPQTSRQKTTNNWVERKTGYQIAGKSASTKKQTSMC